MYFRKHSRPASDEKGVIDAHVGIPNSHSMWKVHTHAQIIPFRRNGANDRNRGVRYLVKLLIESFHGRLALRAVLIHGAWAGGRGMRTTWSEVRSNLLPRDVGSFREGAAPMTLCTDVLGNEDFQYLSYGSPSSLAVSELRSASRMHVAAEVARSE